MTDKKVDIPDFDKWNPMTRDQMLFKLDQCMEELLYKLKFGRIRDSTKTRTRIRLAKAISSIIKAENKIKSDKELEELEERIKLLEEKNESK